jgi:hypothetical protein
MLATLHQCGEFTHGRHARRKLSMSPLEPDSDQEFSVTALQDWITQSALFAPAEREILLDALKLYLDCCKLKLDNES